MGLQDLVKFEKYFWIARVLPAIVSLIPFFIFQYVYLDNFMYQALEFLEKVPFIVNSLITLVVLYIAAQSVRFFGKDLFERMIFQNEKSFPSTELLLFSNNELGKEYKSKLRHKIEREFNYKLLSEKQELKNELEAKIRITDIMGSIRKKVGYSNLILNQYNTEYGFIRNLIGGSILWIIGAIILFIFSFKSNLMYLSILLLLVGVILIIYSSTLLNMFGYKYAKQLFNEYFGGN